VGVCCASVGRPKTHTAQPSLKAARAVRINSIRTKASLTDLAALSDSNAQRDAIVLPKTESPVEIAIVAAALRERPDIRLIPIIESAQGLEGKSSTERAHALIGLAEPSFRDELREQAKKLHLI
jgi:citrate lyase beta subunit